MDSSNKHRHALWQQKRIVSLVLPFFISLAIILAAVILPLSSNLSSLFSSPIAQASSNTLNFQGRLLTNTGGLVADGTYNVEFNIYNVASGGSTLWTEDRLNTNTEGVTVRNGYFSVYLGELDAFGSLDWNQDLYLGMTIRGTSSCAWGACTPTDSEMTPRFELSSVPYAVQASRLATNTGSFTSTLGFVAPTANRTISLPDDDGTVCLTSGNCAGVGGTGDILDGGQAGAISIGTTDTTTVSLLQNGTAALTVNASQLIQFNAYNCSTFANGGTLTTDASGNVVCQDDDGGGASGAPTGSQYLTLALDGALTNERVLTAGTNIGITDGGANSTLTVNVANSPSFSGTLDVTQSVAFQRGTDYSATGTTNNVSFADASLIRLTGASAQTITGIAGGRDGELLTIINAGSNPATLSNESASSTAGNRITTGTGANLSLPVGASLSLVYDSSATRWRVTSAVAGASGAGATSVTNDTNVTGSIASNNLTLGWTGQLSVARGGTGASTFTSNGVIYGNGTGALQATAAGTTGQVLIANGSGVPTFVTLGGDITVNASGATTIGANAVALTTDTTGNYLASLGTATGLTVGGTNGVEGGVPTLSVNYGSSANTAAQGNVTFTCPSGGTNLSGGGNSITIGTGGTCTSLAVVNNPTFSGLITGQAGITITNGGSLATQANADFTTVGVSNNVNLGAGSLVRLTGASTQTITGISGGTNGRILTIINAGANDATIVNNSGSSTAGNRIITGTGGDATVAAGSAITLIYDSSFTVWRLTSDVAGGSGSGLLAEADTLATVTARGATTAVNSTFSGGLNVTGTTNIGQTAGNTTNIGNSTGTLTVTGNSSSSFILNGLTISATELGYLDGVSSNIQTQLNNRQALDATLTSLAAYNTNGILVQTSADTFAGRTLTAGSARVQITNGSGVAGNPSIDVSEADLTLNNIGGTLGVSKGGTGATTLTAGGILYGNGTGAIGASVAGTVGECLVSGGAGAPTWTACAGSGGSGAIGGGGSLNTIPLFTPDGASIGNSIITQSGTTITVAGTLGVDTNLSANGNSTLGNANTDTTTVRGLTTLTDSASGFPLRFGADVNLYRGAANRLDLATGDSLNLVSGNLQIAGTTRISSAGAFTGTGLNSSGSITFSGLNSVGVVQTNASGVLSTGNLNLGTGPVAGTLAVANGGTGSSTLTSNGILYGNGTGAVGVTAAGTTGQCLVGNTGLAPSWTSCNGFTGLTLAGSSGTPQPISNGDTITIAAGSNLTSTAGATGTVTLTVVTNPTFSGLLTANGGLTVEAGDTFTFNGEGFTDLTGTGLTFNAGSLETTLGISIDSSEIVDGTITGTDVATGTIANSNLVNSSFSVNTGSGLTGGGSISLGGSRNLSLGNLTADWVQSGGFDIVLDNAGSELRILESTGGLYYGEFDVGDLNATRLYTFPDASGEVSVLGQTIENSELANSSITVNTGSGLSGGGVVSLGSSLSLTTTLGVSITEDEVVDGTLLARDLNTTNTLGAGVDGYVYSYNNTTGNFTLVDGSLLGGATGVTSLNGLSGGLSVVGNTQIGVSASGSNVNLSINADSITASQLGANSVGASELASTTVGAGTYNTANQVRTFTVDADGRLTAAGSTNIAIAATQITSGSLSVARGGTGAGTFSTNGILYGNGTGALQATSAGTGGQVLLANATGVPTFTTFSGDLTVSNTGVTTISANAIGSSEVINNSLTADDLADNSVTTGEILDNTIQEIDLEITNAPTDDYILTYDLTTGGFTWVDGGSVGTTLTEAQVEDYIFDADNGTKTLSSGRLALNSLTYTGNLNVAQGGTGITSAGAAGGVFYSTGSAFANSGAGTAGQCLISGGAGVPTWSNCGGSGVGATTLQVTYDNGNTITTTDNRNILFTLANTTTDSDFVVNIGASSTSEIAFQNNGSTLFRVDSGGVDLIDVDVADFTGATVTFDAGEILATEIASNSINDTQIQDNSLTALSLAPNSVAASELASTTVTANSYGSASTVATFTVDTDGRLTAASSTAIAINASAINAGTLSVARGGTGAGTFTTNGILYGNGTGALQATSAGTGGQVLIANATGVPTFTTLTGDVTVSDAGVTTIGADSVVLGTDTTGDYVSNVTGGTGVAITGSPAENWTPTIALSYSNTLASNSLGSSETTFSTNGILFEGSISDGFETYLTVTNPTADRTITLPNASGTVAVSASGNIALDGAGNLTVTGQIPVSNGGTGTNTLTNGVLFGNGGSAVSSSGVLSNGQLIIGDGAGNPSIGTLTQGAGITVTNGAGTITIASTLGTSISGSEIVNGTIEAIDLEATNTATNGYVLSSDTATGGFTWIAPGAFATDEATVEAYIFDGDNTGTLSSGTLALNSLSYTGTLGVTNGGTGLTSAGAAGGVYYATAGGTFANTGAGASAGLCLTSNVAAAPTWATCGGGGTPTSLQGAYDNGGTITTTDNKNIAFTLADTATDSGFIVNLQGTGSLFDVQDGGVSKLTVDGAGNVGINDSTPSYQLDVAGTGRFTNNLLVDGNATLGNTATDVLTVVGDANFNSGQLFVDQSTGNVGVGNSSPSFKLTVGVDEALTTSVPVQFGVFNSGGTGLVVRDTTNDTEFYVSSNAFGTQLGTSTNSTLQIYTNNTSRLTVLNTGNVGIGTGSPSQKLEIGGTSSLIALGLNSSGPHGLLFGDDTVSEGLQLLYRSAPNQLIVENANDGSDAADLLTVDVNGTNVIGQLQVNRANHQITLYDTDSAALAWSLTTVSDTGFGLYESATTARLVVASGGDVTISTGNLTVSGGSVFIGDNSGASRISSTTGYGFFVDSNNTQADTSRAFQIRSNTTGFTGGIISMNLLQNGNVTFAGSLSSGPIASSGTITGTRFLGGFGTNTDPGISFSGDDDTGMLRPAANEFRFVAGGIDRLSYSSNRVFIGGGANTTLNVLGPSVSCFIGNGTGNTACSSDSRLKTNVLSSSGDLEKIMQLNPVTFNRIRDGSAAFGFIAQEVQSLYPEAVILGEDGYYALDYASMVGPLTGAVKELKVITDTLNSRLNSAESRLSVLESTTNNLTKANITVNNQLTTVRLKVTGTTELANLKVTGLTELADLKVNGKIITAGNTPTAVLGSTTTGQGSTYTIEGNDTAGSITITTGTNTVLNPLAAGSQVDVTFDEAFSAKPRITLTPTNSESAQIDYFVTKSETGFSIHFASMPTASTEYSFDYQILQ